MSTQIKHLVEEYVTYWRKVKNLKRGSGPYLHPDDLEYLSDKQDLLFHESHAVNYDHEKHKQLIHVDLLPSPYMGDISNAKIIILMGNPGIAKPKDGLIAPPEYQDHKNDVLWDALGCTLHQDFTSETMHDYPYLFLNPELIDTAGGRYDKSMYKKCIEALDKHFGIGEGKKVLSKNICKFQFFPYHSARRPKDKGDFASIPSYQKSVKFLNDLLPAVVNTPNTLVIMTRWIDNLDPHLQLGDNVMISKHPGIVRTNFSAEFGDLIVSHIKKRGVR